MTFYAIDSFESCIASQLYNVQDISWCTLRRRVKQDGIAQGWITLVVLDEVRMSSRAQALDICSEK